MKPGSLRKHWELKDFAFDRRALKVLLNNGIFIVDDWRRFVEKARAAGSFELADDIEKRMDHYKEDDR